MVRARPQVCIIALYQWMLQSTSHRPYQTGFFCYNGQSSSSGLHYSTVSVDAAVNISQAVSDWLLLLQRSELVLRFAL